MSDRYVRCKAVLTKASRTEGVFCAPQRCGQIKDLFML